MISAWRTFSNQWHPTVGEIGLIKGTSPDSSHCQAMVALIEAQQEAAMLGKARGGSAGCRQFVADIKASAWVPASIAIRFTDRPDGFAYEYVCGDRVCFKGSFLDIWDLNLEDMPAAGRLRIDNQVIEYKLHQFKGLFPELTQMWIFLNALVTAHFQRFGRITVRSDASTLKHHRVQFDQQAIDMAFGGKFAVPDLTYTVHRMIVGRYCSDTLMLASHHATLMKVSLGTYRNVCVHDEVDILV